MVASSEPSPASAQGKAAASQQRVVFVTGAGRSGTSTVSGSLKYLGLHVPQPEVPANETNPRGFFETQWVVDFHKQLLERAGVATMDGSPQAADRVRKALASPEITSEMRTWMADAFGQADQVVIKDPRTVWAAPAWDDLARDEGARPVYVSMLRHPAEVVGSRSTYYSKQTEKEKVRRGQVRDVAGWINVNLINEQHTRGHDRVFVQYNDLIGDWRTVMSGVGRDLELDFKADPADGTPHEIDDFIDPDLRRVRVTWDDLDVPASLREIADGVWDAITMLAGGTVSDAEAQQLDDLRKRYTRLHDDSVAIAATHQRYLVGQARRKKRGANQRGANQRGANQRQVSQGEASQGEASQGASRLARRMARRMLPGMRSSR